MPAGRQDCQCSDRIESTNVSLLGRPRYTEAVQTCVQNKKVTEHGARSLQCDKASDELSMPSSDQLSELGGSG